MPPSGLWATTPSVSAGQGHRVASLAAFASTPGQCRNAGESQAFSRMSHREIHVVDVFPCDPEISSERKMWVAATEREDAVAAVVAAVPRGWRVELSSTVLLPEATRAIRLKRGQVSELSRAF